MGRPSKYSKKLGDEIALRIAQGESVRRIGKDPDMPAATTIFRWALDSGHEFCEQYDRAKRIRAETLVDEVIDIADDGSNDYIVNDKGNEVIDTEHVQRSRLRLDTRKWFASKVMPKVYGDKLDVTSDGEKTVPYIFNVPKPD